MIAMIFFGFILVYLYFCISKKRKVKLIESFVMNP